MLRPLHYGRDALSLSKEGCRVKILKYPYRCLHVPFNQWHLDLPLMPN